MPVTIRHCCLDISGGINNARMWRNCITVDGRCSGRRRKSKRSSGSSRLWAAGSCRLETAIILIIRPGAMGHPEEEVVA